MKELILNFHGKFEVVLVTLLLALMMFVMVLAVGEFIYLLFYGLWGRLQAIDSLDFMQSRMHIVFGAFLVLLLGIELMETVKM